MTISYKKIKSHPRIFLRLFGITAQKFDILLSKLKPLWEKEVISRYKRPGRYYKLSLDEMLMMLFLYYRTYTTQIQVGFMFWVDDSRVCRIIRTLEPLVARLVAIEKNRSLNQEELEQLIDVTEQVI